VWSAAYSTFVRCLLSPVATGGRGFSGLNPPNKAPSPPNWNVKHYKLVEFLSIFRISSPPALTQSSPHWKISSDGSESAAYSSFVHMKPNLTPMKQEFKYLRAQWHGQPKILGGSNSLTLGKQQYFVWDTSS